MVDRPEVNICDSSPGVEGLMPRRLSMVTFNCACQYFGVEE